ncbi:MAG TPA: hypothetical protein VIM41_13385 [Gammaproteobacteria bacterium]
MCLHSARRQRLNVIVVVKVHGASRQNPRHALIHPPVAEMFNDGFAVQRILGTLVILERTRGFPITFA